MSFYKQKRIILISIFSALFLVFNMFFTINFYSIKLTLQNLPLFVGALILGPIAGAIIGFMVMFISQLITYGFTMTTIVWVLPHTIIGFIVGSYSKKYNYNLFADGQKFNISFILFIIFANLLITILNTFAFIIDALVFSYYSSILIIGNLFIRIVSSIIVGFFYSLIIPKIYLTIKKALI